MLMGRTHCFQLTRNCDLDPVPRSMGPEHMCPGRAVAIVVFAKPTAQLERRGHRRRPPALAALDKVKMKSAAARPKARPGFGAPLGAASRAGKAQTNGQRAPPILFCELPRAAKHTRQLRGPAACLARAGG
jgi:hypothetical protein